MVSIFPVPFTSNGAEGVAVPMPTRHKEVIANLLSKIFNFTR